MLAEGLVHRWGARAKHAVLMRISSHMRPQRAAYFSDGPTRHHRSGPPPRPRWAVFALLKTRNRLRLLHDEHHGTQACNDADSCATVRNRVHRIYLAAPLHAQAGSKVQTGLSPRL